MKAFLFPGWLALALLLAGPLPAQILNPKKILEKKAAERANKAMEKKADQVLDSVSGKKQAAPAKPDSRPGKTDTVAASGTGAPAADAQTPALQAYSKYDFMPGEKLLFFDDFSQDNVGDFPALWNTNGSGEIVNTNLFEGRWLRFSSREAIWTDALLTLSDNYTIEFDVVPIKGEEGGMAGYSFRLIQSINAKSFDAGAVPGKAGLLFYCEYFGRPGYRTYINGQEGDGLGLSGHKEGEQYYQKMDRKYHVAVWIQKARVRIYVNQDKIFDLPRAFPVASVKMDRIRFENGAALIGNVRVAAGLPDMRNKLMTEGKIVSYGIYFDVNKDVVKPESYASLKEIATILQENPEVRIRVTGHTDSDGADEANLDLSKRRAAAVKQALVTGFGISEARIETDGKGESQPMAANDSPSNKALNRRVEFIKL